MRGRAYELKGARMHYPSVLVRYTSESFLQSSEPLVVVHHGMAFDLTMGFVIRFAVWIVLNRPVNHIHLMSRYLFACSIPYGNSTRPANLGSRKLCHTLLGRFARFSWIVTQSRRVDRGLAVAVVEG